MNATTIGTDGTIRLAERTWRATRDPLDAEAWLGQLERAGRELLPARVELVRAREVHPKRLALAARLGDPRAKALAPDAGESFDFEDYYSRREAIEAVAKAVGGRAWRRTIALYVADCSARSIELSAGALDKAEAVLPIFEQKVPGDRRRRAGVYFRAWVRKLQALGYHLEWRVLNAADFGDATTRERLFIIARKDGKPIEWPAETHSRTGSRTLFGGTDRWRSAADIIDWSIEGRSIFNRKKPLAAKSIQRFYVGAVRFGWPQELQDLLLAHMASRGIEVPDVSAERPGAAEPFCLAQAAGGAPRATTEPLPTIATKGAVSLLVPYYGQSRARPASQPLPTVTTRDRFAFITASFGERKGQRARVRSIDDPAPTVCATGSVRLVEARLLAAGWDIRFRMLEPHELARAMSFDGYVWPVSRTEAVRQIGNAVPVRVAAALVGAVIDTSRRRAA